MNRFARLPVDVVEITTDELQRVPFFVDLSLRADTKSTKEAHRRTPSLHGMLE
jgi:hypothetical protein